jgi:hypothetical protein
MEKGRGSIVLQCSDSNRGPATQGPYSKTQIEVECARCDGVHTQAHACQRSRSTPRLRRVAKLGTRVSAAGSKLRKRGGHKRHLLLGSPCRAKQGRHVGAGKYPPVLLPQPLCFHHRTICHRWRVFTFRCVISAADVYVRHEPAWPVSGK